MDENEKNDGKEFVETIMRIDKSLKASVRNSFKRLFLSASPYLLLLLLLVLPNTFFPLLLSVSSMLSITLLTVSRIKADREEEKIENLLNKDLGKLKEFGSNNKTNNFEYKKNNVYVGSKTHRMNKSSLTNVLSTCLNIEDFHEYMINFFESLKESGKIKQELLNEKAIQDFLNPIYNLLGNDVKVILTADSMADIIVSMQGRKNKKISATYLYDGENFYVYSPMKQTVLLFPISKDDMYKIFDSYNGNYNNALLVQFFTEIYGPLDNSDDLNRGK